MNLVGEKLYQRAQAGEVLSAKERRHTIKWLRMSMAEMSYQDMAQLFQVSVRLIYQDVTKIRRAKTKEVEKEDVMFLIGDLKMAFEKTLRDLEFSQRKAVPGTKTYLDHCRAIFDLRKQLVHLYQEIGLYPKDIAQLTVNTYNLTANVVQDTTREQRAIDLPPIDARVISVGEVDPVRLVITDGKEFNTDHESVQPEGRLQRSEIESS